MLNELPNFRVCMTSINTSEDMERIESEKVKMETVDKIVETLSNLGIELDRYKNVRDSIINEWFGSTMTDNIKKDEASMPPEPMMPEDGGADDEGPDFHSTPSDVSFGGDEGVGEGEPTQDDELLGGEDDTGLEEPAGEPEEDASNEPPQRVPYSLK